MAERIKNYKHDSTFNASERIICSFLIESLNATPLNSIIYITRAALMLPTETCEQVEIDREKIKTIFSIAERLNFASNISIQENKPKYKIDLSSVNYELGLKPWVKMMAYDYYVPAKNITSDEIDTEYNELEKEEKIIYSTKNLTETGYRHMVSDFLEYAIPIVQEWSNILSNGISPDTYLDMLRVYKGVTDDRRS